MIDSPRTGPMILRFPEEDAEKINAMIRAQHSHVAVEVSFNPGSRYGRVFLIDKTQNRPIEGYSYNAEILDLPRHVEDYVVGSSGSNNNMSYINKTADVSQIIIAYRNKSESIINSNETVVHDAQSPLPKESYVLRHGVTPPTKDIVQKSMTMEEVAKKKRTNHEMEKAIIASITGEGVNSQNNF